MQPLANSLVIARKFQDFTSGVSLCITTVYTKCSFRIARKATHNRSEFSYFCERPLRIVALCYIRQLQLTNYNCINVYAFSLTAGKWDLFVV
mgnify:CR=1 FL=1